MKNTYEFNVTGMSCVNCAKRIETSLAQNPEIESAKVNFATKSLVVETALSPNKIITVVEKIGYKAQKAQSDLDLEHQEQVEQKKAKMRLVWATILAVPVLLIGMGHLNFPGSNMMEFIMATLVILGPGNIFFRNAWKLLLQRDASMDTLVALGILASYLFSLWNLTQGHLEHLYFESAASIIVFILFGKFLEEKARFRASETLRQLISIEPKEAFLCDVEPENTTYSPSEKIRSIPARELQVGQRVLVQAGQRFPADGTIFVGKTSVDTSHLTGESRAADLQPGEHVQAGSINLISPVEFLVTATQEKTELGKMLAMVKNSLNSKAKIQRLADKVAAIFVPLMLSIALCVLCGWLVFVPNGFVSGLQAAIAVLVVACPCALGLATPVSILVANSKAASLGILIKDAASLEVLHKVSTIIFDKTGTLTTGKPLISKEEWFSETLSEFSLSIPLGKKILAEVEKFSVHPMAKAVVSSFEAKENLTLPEISFRNISEIPHVGMQAEILLTDNAWHTLQIGKGINAHKDESLIEAKLDSKIMGKFHYEDELAADAPKAIRALKRLKITPIIVTGDKKKNTELFAKELELTFRAEQTPANKAEFIENLKQQGEVVVMVGDGINDAPALAVADVSIAIGTGTDIAIKTAGITLRDGSLTNIVRSITISRATFTNIKQNLFWAFFYNTLLIPLAALGYLTPMLAAFSMALSSLFVVLNALRLKQI